MDPLSTLFLLFAGLNAYFLYKYAAGNRALSEMRARISASEKKVSEEIRAIQESNVEFRHKMRGSLSYVSAETARLSSRANSLELRQARVAREISGIASAIERLLGQNASAVSSVAGELELVNSRLETLEKLAGIRAAQQAVAETLPDGTIQLRVRDRKTA